MGQSCSKTSPYHSGNGDWDRQRYVCIPTTNLPLFSCYNEPYRYFKQLGVPGPKPIPVLGNLATLARFKVSVSRVATCWLLSECKCHDINCYIRTPTSTPHMYTQTCAHTHTHTVTHRCTQNIHATSPHVLADTSTHACRQIKC